MTDLNVFDAGCEPSRGPKAAAVAVVRRLFRTVLRPSSARLAELLGALSGRLDEHEGRIARVDRNVALAEARGVARVEAVLRKADGLSGHIDGLDRDHRGLATEFAWRKSRVESIAEVMGKLSARMDDLDERIRRVEALHWDHVALARRLGVIEDLLASGSGDARTAVEGGAARPLIPFPGLEGVPQARVS